MRESVKENINLEQILYQAINILKTNYFYQL
jgi:hypothetical protein